MNVQLLAYFIRLLGPMFSTFPIHHIAFFPLGKHCCAIPSIRRHLKHPGDMKVL